MKIIYFSPRAFGTIGTPGTYHLVESLSRYANTLVIANQAVNKNLDIVHPPDNNLNLKVITIDKKGYLDEIRQLINEFEPDIFIIANYAKWYEVAEVAKTKRHNLKVVLDIKSPLITDTKSFRQVQHPIQIRGKKNAFLLDLVLSRCEEDIESWLPETNIRHHIYPLGVRINQFYDNNKVNNGKQKKIVFIGSYSQNRQLDKLIKLIYQLPENILNYLHFDFYGSGPFKLELKALVSKLELDSKIKIYDALSQQELFKELANYDIGLGWVPKDIYDAAPSLKAVEYIAAGLIPLLTATTGHVRNLTAGFYAMLFDESSDSLELALTRILKNEINMNHIHSNQERIKKYDWDVIAYESILPALENIKSNINKPYIQGTEKQVQYESHWTPPVNVFQSSKPEKNLATALCATGERLYYGLREELIYIPLSECDWKNQLTKNPDFILLESCTETLWGEWQYSYCGQVKPNIQELIKNAKIKNIPVVLWITLDFEYRNHFRAIAELVDLVAYADNRYKNWLTDSIEISKLIELGPAVQPKLFNPITAVHSATTQQKFYNQILVQGACQFEKSQELQTLIYKSNLNFLGFERNQIPVTNQLRKQNNISSNLDSKGKISYRLLPEILKRSQGILLADSSSTTRTELVWQIIENLACRCNVYVYDDISLEDTIISHFDSFIKNLSKQNSNFLESQLEPLNGLYKDSSLVKAWRDIIDHNTYENRVRKILSNLQINELKEFTYKVTVITPTKRPERLSHILANFYNQRYVDKELIIVVNSYYDNFVKIQKNLPYDHHIKILHMPKDKKAASALNFANQFSNGDFVFRFDDDDYYGSEYLSDAIRYLTIEHMDFIGKFGAFIKIEETGNVYHRKKATAGQYCVQLQAKDLLHANASISGATFGINAKLLNQLNFPESSLRTADSGWLEKIRNYAPNSVILKMDSFQFTIGRNIKNNDHTWSVDLQNILNMTFNIPVILDEVPR